MIILLVIVLECMNCNSYLHSDEEIGEIGKLEMGYYVIYTRTKLGKLRAWNARV